MCGDCGWSEVSVCHTRSGVFYGTVSGTEMWSGRILVSLLSSVSLFSAVDTKTGKVSSRFGPVCIIHHLFNLFTSTKSNLD